MGCHVLLQGIFPTQGLNPCLPHLLLCRWILYCWATSRYLISSIIFNIQTSCWTPTFHVPFLHPGNLKLLCLSVCGKRPVRITGYTSSQILKPSFGSAGNSHSWTWRLLVLSVYQNNLEGLLKHRLLGSTYNASDSVGLGWDPRICTSKEFPEDAGADLKTHLENHCFDHLVTSFLEKELMDAWQSSNFILVFTCSKTFVNKDLSCLNPRR